MCKGPETENISLVLATSELVQLKEESKNSLPTMVNHGGRWVSLYSLEILSRWLIVMLNCHQCGQNKNKH